MNTRIVATAKIVGLICSRMPENIWRGIVRWVTSGHLDFEEGANWVSAHGLGGAHEAVVKAHEGGGDGDDDEGGSQNCVGEDEAEIGFGEANAGEGEEEA